MPRPALADGSGVGIIVDNDVVPDVMLKEAFDRHLRPAVPPRWRYDKPLALVNRPRARSSYSEDPLISYAEFSQVLARDLGSFGDEGFRLEAR